MWNNAKTNIKPAKVTIMDNLIRTEKIRYKSTAIVIVIMKDNNTGLIFWKTLHLILACIVRR